MEMLKISRRVRERPARLVAAVGAMWLVILSAVTFYAKEAAEPAPDAVAVFELPHSGGEQASSRL